MDVILVTFSAELLIGLGFADASDHDGPEMFTLSVGVSVLPFQVLEIWVTGVLQLRLTVSNTSPTLI